MEIVVNMRKRSKFECTIPNCLNMVLMTCEKGIKEKDIISFQCTLARDGDGDYYNMLREHLNRPEVARAFFQFLMARNYDSSARIGEKKLQRFSAYDDRY